MASCSTSSNIKSSFTALTTTNGGSRLVISIPYIAGFTTGQVIRYDVPSSGYTAAKADQAATSEVFGVIESFNSTTSPSLVNVVIYGSVNINSAKLADVGSGGGSGGNDIYFLSGTTAGVLQNLAPTNIDHVIKPVYQIAPHGTYDGIVINYLGYKIGGDIQGSISESEGVGTISFLLGEDSTFEEGVVDASISRQLPISEYPEYYEQFASVYGYIERLGITGGASLSGVAIGNTVTQPNSSTYLGTVSAVSNAEKYIFVKRAPNAELASLNKVINVATSNGNVSFTLYSAVVYATETPIISTTPPFNITLANGSAAPTQTVKVGLKVKPKGVQIFVPDTVTVTNLRATGISLGNVDLATELGI